MNGLLLAALNFADAWYVLPLIVAISLVYAATRHERMDAILFRALRVGTMMFVMMGILLVLLLLLDRLT